MINLEKRVQTDSNTTTEDYINGIVVLCKELVDPLKTYLEEEGRFHGIMIKYMEDINKALANILKTGLDKKILYLYKPAIIIEFNKLVRRHVSKADSLICILHKILQLIVEYEDNKKLKKFYKIISRIYNNIKNNAKKSSLFFLISSIRKYMILGLVGKYEMNKIQLLKPKVEKTKLDKNITEINISSEITEIEF